MIRSKRLASFVALMLLSFTLSFVEFTSTVQANPTMYDNLFGEKPPPGITINGDGTISGTDRIIQTDDFAYTLMSDITDSITILKNDVTLDGNGHTLLGRSDQIGLFIQQRDGITIKNLKIEGCGSAIRLAWRHYGDTDGRTITVTHNTFSGNKNAIGFGDHLQGSNITDNVFVANTNSVTGAAGVSFRNNLFNDNEHCLPYDRGLNFIDTSNQVNGKTAYYWVNMQDKVVPSDAGWVVLSNCTNITVQGLNLTRAGGEVQLYNTIGSTIKGNILSKSGISLYQSDSNTVEDNKISQVNYAGLSLQGSKENMVVANQIINSVRGISMEFSENNTVCQNQLTSNTVGLQMSVPYQNSSASTTLISQNIVSKNSIGISLYATKGATIALNNITDNLDWGMKLDGNPKNNSIHHNNFIGNNVTDKLQVCITGFWKQMDNGSIVNGTHQPPRRDFVAGEANFWNDTSGGNYWSDYTARYTDATELGDIGIGDTPFFINQNNIDWYPLTAPVDITKTYELLPNQEYSEDTGGAHATQEIENTPQNLGLPVLLAITSAIIVAIGLAVFFVKRRS
jgi:parallel beta-helix repeat protein